MAGLLVSLGVATTLLLGDAPSPEEVTLSGEVVELTEALQAHGIDADPGPIAGQVVLRGDDGAITPLLSDEAGRALFLDERLRHRRVEVLGHRREGLPYVQVITVKVEEDGVLRTPEYHCEVCAIKVRYPQVCPCCQGDMELRFLP